MRVASGVVAIALVVLPLPSWGTQVINGYSLKSGLAAYARIEGTGGPMKPDDNWAGYTSVGYVLGIFDFLDRTGQVCAPVTANIHKITGVVAKYLDDHPGDLRNGGDAIVAKALTAAFPCHAPASR